MKPSTPKQRYLISVVARFEWREYQCQYILIHFHEMHLVIKFKRTYYSCQWKRRSFPGTKRNSIWRPLITCACVRCRACRNTLPRIRLIGTGNSCLTVACAFMPWWQTRAAPFLWTCSCATEWSLLVFMMAEMEIHCPWAWQTWVAPSTSPALLLSSGPHSALHQ